MIGKVLIFLALVSTLISAAHYFRLGKLESKPKKDKKKNKSILEPTQFFARMSFYLMTIFVSLSSVYLWFLILTHKFQFNYVYSYSSKDLPFGFLISTFWAGQEGSFLFWTLLIALMGVIFIKTSKELESWGMFFLNIIQAFFLIILIKASPFTLLPKIPADGSGLNPLLQNFWMVIHPPVLFFGYAAGSFPLVLGLAALVRKKYDSWVNQALPWTIFTSVTLGAGIILGAFWAYETLGWGGYWGWDPVENSSLIPWLTILALIHSLVVQKTKGSFRKTNFVIAIVSFLLIIYATFLTRSGILADFSVHSFADLGINSILIAFIIAMAALSFGLFFFRRNDIPVLHVDKSMVNRENGLMMSIYVFLIMAFLTFIGTSSPIITGLFSNPSQINIDFYNKVNLPVAILMALLLGIIPVLAWSEHKFNQLFKKLILPMVLTVVTSVIAVLLGVNKPILIIFVLMTLFTLWTNGILIFDKWKNRGLNIGAPLSHFGLGLIFLGIIVSGNFDVSEKIVLEKNIPLKALKHQFTYEGMTAMPNGKNIVNVKVIGEGGEFRAQPRVYMTKRDGMMREPDIKLGILEDLYLSPLEMMKSKGPGGGYELTLTKGQKENFEGYDIHFIEYDMQNHSEGGNMSVGAILEISKSNKKYSLVPRIVMTSTGKKILPASLPKDKYAMGMNTPSISLIGLDATSKTIQLKMAGFSDTNLEKKEDKLILEVSTKPFMNVLWLGTILLLIGGIIGLKNRISQVSD